MMYMGVVSIFVVLRGRRDCLVPPHAHICNNTHGLVWFIYFSRVFFFNYYVQPMRFCLHCDVVGLSAIERRCMGSRCQFVFIDWFISLLLIYYYVLINAARPYTAHTPPTPYTTLILHIFILTYTKHIPFNLSSSLPSSLFLSLPSLSSSLFLFLPFLPPLFLPFLPSLTLSSFSIFPFPSFFSLRSPFPKIYLNLPKST